VGGITAKLVTCSVFTKLLTIFGSQAAPRMIMSFANISQAVRDDWIETRLRNPSIEGQTFYDHS
jgi:hypothetical protein